MTAAEQLGWEGVSAITDKVEGSHRRFAECRRRFDRLNGDLDSAFRQYEAVRAELAEVGTRSEHVLEPPLAAAYGAWKAHGPKETRVVLEDVGEAPIPPDGS